MSKDVAGNSFLDAVKEKVSFAQWSKYFDFSLQHVIDIAMYCGIGFIIGFVIKKYGRFLFVGLALSSVFLWSLEYIHVITVDVSVVKSWFGLQKGQTIEAIFGAIGLWMQSNVTQALSSGISFLIGYKAG